MIAKKVIKMNQETINKIATILKGKIMWETMMGREHIVSIANDLADLFEREELQNRKEFAKSQNMKLAEVTPTFNRKDFLKRCGVE